MSGSPHIRSVLIGVEYRNRCRNLDVYLQWQSASRSIGKLRPQKNNKTVNKSHFNLFDLKQSLVFYNNAQLKQRKINKHPKFNDNFDIQRQTLLI